MKTWKFMFLALKKPQVSKNVTLKFSIKPVCKQQYILIT